jgi:hypothetical protein
VARRQGGMGLLHRDAIYAWRQELAPKGRVQIRTNLLRMFANSGQLRNTRSPKHWRLVTQVVINPLPDRLVHS